MNKHQGFLTNNAQVKRKNSHAPKYFTLASMSALLAACNTEATSTPTSTPTPTASAIATINDDVITASTQNSVLIVDALAGNDKITGGDLADFIRGNTGADDINGGAGVDNIVVIGKTSNGSYTLSDIQNPNDTGIDLSVILTLDGVNNNAVSDIQAGEVIDGGADGARLFVYGDADFTGVTLLNITQIDMHSYVSFSASQIKAMIDQGTLKFFVGDGTSTLVITNDGSNVELDFSGIKMYNVHTLVIPNGVTMVMDQNDFHNMQNITGSGSIKAASGQLVLGDIKIQTTIKIYDADGNLIIQPVVNGPEFGSASTLEINVAEDTTHVGSVSATDADGDVISYTIMPTGDGALFNIDKTSGTVSFKAAPDFDNPTDAGANNVYDITVTATTADGLNASKNVAITVIDLNVTGAVSIGSSAFKGLAITATNTLADVDGLGTLHYQWKSGIDNVGTDSDTYTPVTGDVGKTISVVVTYTDGKGTDETVTSNNNTALPSIPQLSSLNGTDGFKLSGEGGSSGQSVSSAGDVNGDGFDDFIIGAHHLNGSAGSSYVVYGKANGFAANVNLADIATGNGSQGFRLVGESGDSGYSVSSAGDVNGDGYDDLIIGAFGTGFTAVQSGSSYVVYGKANDNSGTIDLSAIVSGNGNLGYRFDGEAGGDYSGRSVSSAGDVNGDGYDDLLVGAYLATTPNGTQSGYSYVIYGKATVSNGSFNLSTITNGGGSLGFRLYGETANDRSGRSVSSAGDVNGDGYDDLIIGAYDADSGKGYTYVVYGKPTNISATISLADIVASNGIEGFRFNGDGASDISGYSVSSAGDVNGDGYDDLIVGASGADFNGKTGSGSSYVVYGKANSNDSEVNLSAISGGDGSLGFRLDGEVADDNFGYSVSSAGDVNGDGYDDLIVGAYYAKFNGTYSGSSYVIYGAANGNNGIIGLGTIAASNGTLGFRLDGEADSDFNGGSASAAGDINADGFDDLIVGAYGANSDAGSSYVIFGRAQLAGNVNAVTMGSNIIIGTSSAETLNGTAAADVINAALGADTITAGVGSDNMWGGGGLDTFIFAAGDSVITIGGIGNAGTVTGYDVIHDFATSDTTRDSETFDTVGTATIGTFTHATNSTLTIGGNAIQSNAISNGVITFDDQGGFADALDISTPGNVAAVLQYLQAHDLGDAGATLAFNVGSDAFIFTQGDDAGTDNLDVVVRLESTHIDSLLTTNGHVGPFDLFIA